MRIDRDLPLKREISGNIRKLMKVRGWTQMQLSKESGISKSTISDYINCRTLISSGNVQKIAEAFNVSKAEIDPSFKSDSPINEKQFDYDSRVSKLPIFGSISCGNGVIAYEDIEGYEDIPKAWTKGGSYFLLRAKGDSMINARIQEGDLLLIRKQETFENGEIIAVAIDDEAVLKRIYKIDGAIMLQSENSKYPPRIVTNENDIRIIGKLKMNLIRY